MGDLFDTREVQRLAVDLTEAPKRLQFKAPKTMKKSALEIKRRMIEEFSGHGHAPYVQGSFEFEQRDGLGLAYEIGELNSAGPQWGLAALLAFGSSNNAPVADHRKALLEETPIMLQHLGVDAEDAVLGGSE